MAKSNGAVVALNDQQTQKFGRVKNILEKQAPDLFRALPRHITQDRMLRIVLTCIRKNPKLLECSVDSLFASIIQAASLGLEPDGILGHACLIPYKTECVLVPGFKGLLELCRRSGQIKSITCESVHAGDVFHYRLGDEPSIQHIPSEAADRYEQPITHVYAVVQLTGGGVQRSVWPAARIDAHKRAYSQGFRTAEQYGKNDSPWHTNWPEMAKKTVLRDMVNRGLLPLSPEIQRGLAAEEIVEAGIGMTNAAALSAHALAGSLGHNETISVPSEAAEQIEHDPESDPTEPLPLKERLAACQTEAAVNELRASEIDTLDRDDEHGWNCVNQDCDGRIAELAKPKAKKGQGSLLGGNEGTGNQP